MSSFKQQFSTGFKDDKGLPDLRPDQSSLIVAILSVGTVVGALIAAPIGDMFGRRKSLIASVGVFSLGVIFQICSADIPMLIVGRYAVSPDHRQFTVETSPLTSLQATRWRRRRLCLCAGSPLPS